MSKVDDLRQKYQQIAKSTFNKFEEGDTTPTKKYLEYMLKSWVDRENYKQKRTVRGIIENVLRFDALIPHVENKDIYSKEYSDYRKLEHTVIVAQDAKEDKSFVRQDHVNVLIENERFLLLVPKTHQGSIKYGANTKWCTTTKKSDNLFNKYSTEGLLAYLIDKAGDKHEDFKKIAFNMNYGNSGLNDCFTIYDVKDRYTGETMMTERGWDSDDLFQVFSTLRYLFVKTKEYKKNKDFVDSFVRTVSSLDIDKFERCFTKLDETSNDDYIKETKTKIETFVSSIKKSKYGNK
jgi:hypothetical protein